jgi:hypothetical protein
VKKLLALSIILLASIECCFAIEPEAILKNMPATYSGTYVWQESKDTWNMSVSFTDRKIGRNGEVEFSGMEYFVHAKDKYKKFDSKVRAVVNSQTLAFDMSEISDQPQKGGFTAMVYTGKISANLSSIKASWVGSDGKKVVVDLTARSR